jgi:hypothetical protein
VIRTGQVVKFLLDDSFNVVEIREMQFHFLKQDCDKGSHENRGYVLLDATKFTVLFPCVWLPLKLCNGKRKYSAVRDAYTMIDQSGPFV